MDLTKLFRDPEAPAGAAPCSEKAVRAVFLTCSVPLTLVLLMDAVLNMRWRVFHDAATMAYYSFLMNHFHWMPYRDFLEMNMPGVHLFNALMGRLFGYSDLGFRLGDFTTLSVILIFTWVWLRRLGWKVAWAACAGFCFLYYSQGPLLSMQREFILLIPLSLALVIASSPGSGNAGRSLGVGLCFGCAFLIKPLAVIGYPLLFIFLLRAPEPEGIAGPMGGRRTLRLAAWTSIGFLLPIGLTSFWLWRNGALTAFLNVAGNYWPLYAQMSGEHRILMPGERPAYLLRSYLEFNGMWNLFWPAGLGLIIALWNSGLDKDRRRQVLGLSALAFTYSLYPVLAGKFWSYHWLIFMYFLCALGALCLVDQPSSTRRILRIFPMAVFFLAFFLPPPFWHTLGLHLRGKSDYYLQIERGDALAAFLKKHLRPGDTVQPLDWTGGTHQAMLAARAKPATPFLTDECFYHHVSHPYIQRLRARFIEGLNAARPRFILRIMERDIPAEGGTSNRFEALETFLADLYRPILVDRSLLFTIYEKKADPPGTGPADSRPDATSGARPPD